MCVLLASCHNPLCLYLHVACGRAAPKPHICGIVASDAAVAYSAASRSQVPNHPALQPRLAAVRNVSVTAAHSSLCLCQHLQQSWRGLRASQFSGGALGGHVLARSPRW